MSQFLFEGGDGFAFNKFNNKFHSIGECYTSSIREFPLIIINNCIRQNRFTSYQRRNSYQISDLD